MLILFFVYCKSHGIISYQECKRQREGQELILLIMKIEGNAQWAMQQNLIQPKNTITLPYLFLKIYSSQSVLDALPLELSHSTTKV